MPGGRSGTPIVLVVGRVRAQGRDGQIGDIPVHWVWEIEDGSIVKGSVFTDREEALAEAGLSANKA
jgi:ketosteroid isomerase-like protein